MQTIDLIQGSPEWAAHRAKFYNASDAPAMMGCSPYKTRNQLLQELATGVKPDVDAATQRRFDDGHRAEALARPLAEQIVGEDLFPVVGVEGELSASFDGLTMMEDTAFEHKALNESLRYAHWDEGNGEHLPLHYRVQMEHQIMVSGCARVLFMATKWDGDTLVEKRHCWYYPDGKLRGEIGRGWAQFKADLATFVPTAPELPKATGRAPETLPSLRIEVTGMVTASNLDEFKAQALAVFQGINRDLKTDADFSDAEATVKWAKGIEDRLSAAKDAALAQTETIDRLFRTIDDIAAEARRVRLDLDKLVKARKDALRSDIVVAGQTALQKFVRELNATMPGDYMPPVLADFAGCIKGLKSLDSIRNAVDTELAKAKVTASEIANRIHANVMSIKDSGLVVHDAAALVLKQPDDLAAVLAQRLAAEREREERARERLRQEHEAQVAREAAAREAAAREASAREDAARAMAEQAVAVAASAPGPEQATARPAPVFKPASPPAIEADNGERLNLSQINARLAPLAISAAGLAELGFDPVETVKASKLFRASDFERMCSVLVLHIRGVAALA